MKKVFPFWIASMIAAILGIVILYNKNIRIINYIQYPETNPLLLAEAYKEEAEKYYKKTADIYAALSREPDRKEKMKNLPELQRSKRLFLESLRLKPNMKGIYPFLADLAEFEGDLPSMYLYQGKRALSDKQLDSALEAFDFSLNIRKDFRPAIEEMIATCIRIGDLDKAQTFLERLFRIFEEKNIQPDAQAFFLKSQLALHRGNHAERRTALEKALQNDPAHLEAARNLAGVLMGNKEYNRAIMVIEKARASAPDDANLLHWLGRIYIGKGEFALASKSLENALKIEKHSAPLYLDLARAYDKLGQKTRSSVMLQKAIDIDTSLKNSILFPDAD